jgi:hypothetical protein
MSSCIQLEKSPDRSIEVTGFSLVELLVVVSILIVLASFVIPNVTAIGEDSKVSAGQIALGVIREAITGTPGNPGFLNDMKPVLGYRVADLRVHDLLSASSCTNCSAFNPFSGRGWRGPYINNVQPVWNISIQRAGLFPAAYDRRFDSDSTFRDRKFYYDAAHSYYGAAGDNAMADPWGNPIVIQVPPAEEFTNVVSDAKRFRYARLVSAGPDGVLDTPRDRLAGRQSDGTTAMRGDDLVLFLNRADIYENEEP